MTLSLRDRRILVVEDEYYLAMELEQDLRRIGAAVLGPVPSVERALALIASEPRIDAAVLDLSLGGEMAHPVAEALIARKVPLVLATGFGDGDIIDRYPRVVHCVKPVDFGKLQAALVSALAAQAHPVTEPARAP